MDAFSMLYVGNGIYAGCDGFQIKLCANDPFDPSGVVFIEESDLVKLAVLAGVVL